MPKKKFKPEKSCFVIMPLSHSKESPGLSFLTLYEELFEPAISAHQGLYYYRCDKALMGVTGMITHFILDRVVKSDVLVADVTDFNPNVLWELGVRHSFVDFGTILVCQKNRDNSDPVIPFDLKDMNTIFYSTYLTQNIKSDFFNCISNCLNNFETKGPVESEKLDSPIYRFNIDNIKSLKERLPRLEEDKILLEQKISDLSIPSNVQELEDYILELERICNESGINLPSKRPFIKSENL